VCRRFKSAPAHLFFTPLSFKYTSCHLLPNLFFCNGLESHRLLKFFVIYLFRSDICRRPVTIKVITFCKLVYKLLLEEAFVMIFGLSIVSPRISRHIDKRHVLRLGNQEAAIGAPTENGFFGVEVAGNTEPDVGGTGGRFCGYSRVL
jgi:hypothetical protein